MTLSWYPIAGIRSRSAVTRGCATPVPCPAGETDTLSIAVPATTSAPTCVRMRF